MMRALALVVLGCKPHAGDAPRAPACDTVLYADRDADGHGDASTAGCQGVALADDCDDADPQRHPGLPERCDEVDNDCDGLTDEDLPLLTGYADADGDGYGDPAVRIEACSLPDGYLATSDDCDDTRSEVHPGPTDTCNDGLDQNCDGADDSACDMLGVREITDAALGRVDPVATESFGAVLTLVPAEPLAIGAGQLVWDDPGYHGEVAFLPAAGFQLTLFAAMSRWQDTAEASLGATIAAVGDMDADGTTDIAIDASGLKLYRFEESGTFTGDDWFARFDPTMGRTVTAPGDLDADGYADLAVSHYYEPSPTVEHAGVVRLFAGPFAGDYVADDAIARWWGVDDQARFGWALASRDLDADGRSDMVVSSPFEETDGGIHGGLWLVSGPWTGSGAVADFASAHVSGTDAAQGTGWTLDTALDVDGDGYDEVLSGGRSVPPWEGDPAGQDRVCELIPGNVAGDHDAAAVALARFSVTSPYDGVEVQVAGAGDLDGDGFGDVAISAPYHSGPDGHLGGSVFVFYGPVEGEQVLEEADLWLYHDQPYAELGYALERGADLDEDGFDDLVIGAPNGLGTGQVWLFFGG